MVVNNGELTSMRMILGCGATAPATEVKHESIDLSFVGVQDEL